MNRKHAFKRFDQYLLDCSDRIGKGMYGDVYMGYYYVKDEFSNKANIQLAIKETPMPQGFNQQEQDQKKQSAIKEINILRQLNHPNIIKFIDAKRTPNNIYLVMEYCNGGDFAQLLKTLYTEKKQVSEMEILSYFREIIDAFRYLREKQMVHRDIKPENILVHDGNLKVADFGFSRVVGENDVQQTVSGTPLFQDPNIQDEKGYSDKSDIFSLGILLWHMLYYDIQTPANSYPWYAQAALKLVQQMTEKEIKFPDERRVVSPQVKKLIKDMVHINADKRISWENLFSHELLKTKLDIEISRQDNLNQSQPIQKSIKENIDVNQLETLDEQDQNMTEQLQNAKDFKQRAKDKQKLKIQSKECTSRLDFEKQTSLYIFSTATKFFQQVMPFLSEYGGNFPEELQQELLYILYKKCYMKYKKLYDCVQNRKNMFNIKEEAWQSFLEDNQTILKFHKKTTENLKLCEVNYLKFYESANSYFNGANHQINKDYSIESQYSDQVLKKSLTELVKPLILIHSTLQKGKPLSTQDSILLDVIYNLLMIYSSVTTFKYDTHKPIDFYKFYDERKMISKKVLFNRIIKAYDQFNITITL